MTNEERSRKRAISPNNGKFSFKLLFAKDNRHYAVFSVVLLSAAFLLITGNWFLFARKENYRVGYPSPRSYFALSAAVYEDREATKELRERASSRIVDVVTKDEKVASAVSANLSDFKNGNYKKILNSELSELFTSLPYKTRKKITLIVLSTGKKIGSRAETVEEQSAMIWHELKDCKLSQADKNVAFQILNSLMSPYVMHDVEMTESLKKNIASHIPSVVRNIQPGVLLVEKGEIVTRRSAELLRSQGYSDADFPTRQIIFTLLLIAIWSAWPVWIEKGLRQKLIPSEWMYVAAVLVLSWLLELLFAHINRNYAMAVLATTGWLCLSIPVSLSYHLILGGGAISVLIAFNNNQTIVALGFILAAFAASIGRILFFNPPGHRGGIWKRLFMLGILLSVISVFVNWGAGMPLNYNQIINLFVFAAIWSTLVIALLPIWESCFNIISPLRLLELCDQAQPLLKRMQLEAPGTYHHTMMVGNLVLAAADKLGINGNLMRAGAYYHDIGKLKHPRYFVENQMRGENPHDKLAPAVSAQIIISHVKDGLEIADHERLPKALRRFIAEHHGTTVQKYFYEKAKAMGVPVTQQQFTYPGPTPQSVETALIMLADSVEAAVKARNKPFETLQGLEETIDQVFVSKIDAGQLDNADFSMKEIRIIKDSFASVLASTYHSREVADIPELVKQLKTEEKNDEN